MSTTMTFAPNRARALWASPLLMALLAGCGGGDSNSTNVAAAEDTAAQDARTTTIASAEDLPSRAVGNPTSVTVRARGMLAGGVGPKMVVRVNGQIASSPAVTEVKSTTLANYTFSTAAISAGSIVDVVFTNDAVVNGQDRNLIVESITINGVVLPSTGANVRYDRGDGAGAFDGVDVLAGRAGMAWGGALRYTVPATAAGTATSTTGTTTAPKPTTVAAVGSGTTTTTPAPAPTYSGSGNIVPANSIPMGASIGAYTWSYPTAASGSVRVVNNVWGTNGLPGGWSQQTGISSLQGDGSVACRFKWNYPQTASGKEVLAYPECTYGRSASFGPDAGAQLPRLANQVNSLVTSYSNIAGWASGQGQITYDLWTSNSPNGLSSANRRAEIMMPVHPVGGYGVPNYPNAAAAGRTGTATGRNPNGYQGRQYLGGAAYDVYWFPAYSQYTGLAWQFIVFEPVNFPGTNGHTLDWKPLLSYAQGRGWINGSDYLNSVEIGYEPVGAGAAGDLTVSGFKVSTN